MFVEVHQVAIVIYLLTPTRVAGVKRSSASVCVCVCVCVCLHDRTKSAETTITKGIVHHESWLYPFNIGSKGHRSRSQGHKVQKHIQAIEWPA